MATVLERRTSKPAPTAANIEVMRISADSCFLRLVPPSPLGLFVMGECGMLRDLLVAGPSSRDSGKASSSLSGEIYKDHFISSSSVIL